MVRKKLSIEGWKKTSEDMWEQVVDKPECLQYKNGWGNNKVKIFVLVKENNFRKGVWNIILGGKSGYVTRLKKNYDTEDKAITAAKKYMKMYPEGN